MEHADDVALKPNFNFFVILFSASEPLFFVYFILIPVVIALSAAGFLIFSCVLLAFVIFSIEFAVFMNYRATNYTIGQDKILFEEGFINHQSSSIKFQNIKEIHLTQSFVQRIFKLGTIRILTAGSNQENGGGLKILNIKSSTSVYMFLNKRLHSILNKEKTSLKEIENKVVNLKPDFKTNYYLVNSLFYGVAAGIVSPLILLCIATSIDFIDRTTLLMFIGTSLLSAVLIALLVNFFIRLEYKNRKYLLSATKVESKEGFFNYHYSSIDMRNVREIRLERGFIQRFFNLGSIVISTPANNKPCEQVNESNILGNLFGFKNNNNTQLFYRTGIKFSNLSDSLKIYKTLKKLNDFVVSKKPRNIENDVPQYTYKPTFNLFLQVSYNIILLALLVFMIIPLVMGAIPAVVVFLIAILLVYVIPVYLQKKNYDCTKYEVYPTRIEFHEGFINNKSSSVLIENKL